jgi:hypothetical protein
MGSLLSAKTKSPEQNLGASKSGKAMHCKKNHQYKKIMYANFFTSQGPTSHSAVPGKSVNAKALQN